MKTTSLIAAFFLVGPPQAETPTETPPTEEPTTQEPTTEEPTTEPPPTEGPTEEPTAKDPVQTDITPEGPPPASADPANVSRLSGEARQLRDDLFKARARVAIVGSKLFKAKLQLEVRGNLERFYVVSDLVLTLDGAPVFSREKGMPPTSGYVFESFAAPGSHDLGVSAVLVSRRDPTYKMRVDQTFTVVVPEDSTVSSRLIMRETGNMWRFAKRKRGRYQVNMRLRAKAKANDRKKKRKGAKAKVGVSAGSSK